jgi:hypothetical protein
LAWLRYRDRLVSLLDEWEAANQIVQPRKGSFCIGARGMRGYIREYGSQRIKKQAGFDIIAGFCADGAVTPNNRDIDYACQDQQLKPTLSLAQDFDDLRRRVARNPSLLPNLELLKVSGGIQVSARTLSLCSKIL